MSKIPTITLITPVMNAASTLTDCLASIDCQTVPCQHIVIDGGSTDGTQDILCASKAEGRVVVSETDEGLYDAINKGLTLATGDVVGILNADDFYMHESILGSVVECLLNPNIDACYGDLEYVDRINCEKVVRRWRSGGYDSRKFYNGWMPPHPTFFLRRSFYEEYSGYRLDLGTAADYELMLRMLLKHRARTAYLPGVMIRMRNEGVSNASMLNRWRANQFDRQAWRVNGLRPRPWTFLAKPLRKVNQWL